MNLSKALKTEFTVKATGTNDTVKDGKLELKQLNEKKFNVSLEIQNYSDKDKKLYISHEGIYEPIENGSRTQKAKLLENKLYGEKN